MNLYRYIIEKVGYDSFFEGRYYSPTDINKDKTEKRKNSFIHYYSVYSNKTNKKYKVMIKNNGDDIIDLYCDCMLFSHLHTCEHVAAVLIENVDEIIEYEIIDEVSRSEQILSKYNNSKKKNLVKEKLNVEIEFNFNSNHIYLRLYVGNTKKYVLSNLKKIENFLDAYCYKEMYRFGKVLTYDPDIHYFDDNTTEILNYIIECIETKRNQRYYYDNAFSLTHHEFKSIIKILDKQLFSIQNYGKFNQLIYGLPTEYYLSKKENNFILAIKDYDKYTFLDNENNYVIYDKNLYLLNKEDSNFLSLLQKNKINHLVFTNNNLEQFSNGLFNKLKNNIKIDEEITEISFPIKPTVKLYFDIAYSYLKCDIKFNYKDKDINYFEKTGVLRDVEFEQKVVEEIINYGFDSQNNTFIMTDEDNMYTFIDEKLNQLSEKYKVFTSKKINNTNIIKKVSSSNNFSIGKDGIMSYKFDVEGINSEELNNLFSALKSKKRYYKLKNNNVVDLNNNDELNELSNLIDELDISKKDIVQGEAIIPKYSALYIDSLKNNTYKNIKTNNLFDRFIKNFKKYKNSKIEFDEDDKILRDYQKEGVKWLNTIYKCDLGGILADEMGLGKSLQTITFIKQILKEKSDAKIIIVVPTSLIYNWQKEFEKFAPNLKYIVVTDSKQKRKEIFDRKDEYNIFITSYGLIRNDKDEYEEVNFELCVVDEAQNIKNYQSQMAKEIKKIKAKCKIALTGTPLENNVTELWSIFDFIMPGYLNNIINFRKKYNIKDVDDESLKLLKSLNYQIKPFILRRKKQDVIKSLPNKIENKIYIDLPEKQKMLYLKVLNDTKKEMDELINNGGFQKSRMKILQLLTKLRQICIDPNVMYDNYTGESIKIEELQRIVQENIENGHKILIFSSFKRVLENVKKEFEKNNISYYMIDGSVKSKERMQMVESFNQDDTNCFLITLKSGGTGLNLTGADVVIHLDIWWNPQVENQATDRAHRIGQTKTVSVIKLITNGTIEERIIELQEKKKILSENLIEGKSNSENLSSLTEKDIRKLLSISEK